MSDPTTIISLIPRQPQRQDSLAEQMRDLRIAAIRLGLYDAYDHLFQMMRSEEGDHE